MNKLKLIVAAAMVAAAFVGWWRYDVAATERDAAMARAESLKADNDEQADQLQQYAAELRAQQDRADRLAEIERDMRTIRQTIASQAEAQRAGFEELKRNDQAVRDYLRGRVPDALGVRYQRSATTDPAAYRRAGDGVPAGAVSTPGTQSAGNQ